ncbi:MAG: cytochrome C oxidase subunit IV family protein [Desulfurococcales archaeon]|nr:cytochrome C oxidase subunit IV family protein [Desulfurococcales archaeon]
MEARGEFRINETVYVAVWLVLLVTAGIEVYVIKAGIAFNPIVFVFSMAMVQTSLIALFFQHLREEPSSVKLLPVSSLFMLIVLISAAVTSVLACTPYLGGGGA